MTLLSRSSIRLAVFASEKEQEQAIISLRTGERFCVGCGTVAISANAPEFMKKCRTCYAEAVKAAYCSICGEEIEESRKNWTRDRHKKECTRCGLCSKCGIEIRKCETCDVPHPASWKCFPREKQIAPSTSHL